MAHELHAAVDGKPVGVDVQDRHEDRQLQYAPLKHLGLVHFLECHDSAVDRRHHHIVAVTGEVAAGAVEKVEHQQVEDGRDGREYGRYETYTDEEPCQEIEHSQHEKQYDQNVGAFAVYLDFHLYLFPSF